MSRNNSARFNRNQRFRGYRPGVARLVALSLGYRWPLLAVIEGGRP